VSGGKFLYQLPAPYSRSIFRPNDGKQFTEIDPQRWPWTAESRGVLPDSLEKPWTPPSWWGPGRQPAPVVRRHPVAKTPNAVLPLSLPPLKKATGEQLRAWLTGGMILFQTVSGRLAHHRFYESGSWKVEWLEGEDQRILELKKSKLKKLRLKE
jgi:hypothetical protein